MTKTQTAPAAPFNDSRDELAAQPELTELRRLTGSEALYLANRLEGSVLRITDVYGDDQPDLFWEIEFVRGDIAELIGNRY